MTTTTNINGAPGFCTKEGLLAEAVDLLGGRGVAGGEKSSIYYFVIMLSVVTAALTIVFNSVFVSLQQMPLLLVLLHPPSPNPP